MERNTLKLSAFRRRILQQCPLVLLSLKCEWMLPGKDPAVQKAASFSACKSKPLTENAQGKDQIHGT